MGENQQKLRGNASNDILKQPSSGQIPQPCKLMLKDL